MLSIWEVLERAQTGERMEEKKFDMLIYEKTKALLEEYPIIKYRRETPVPLDDEEIDAVFQAAIKLYAQTGTYCIDTGRVIGFSENELREVLTSGPKEIKAGQGNDEVTFVHRDIGGKQDVVVCSGIETIPYSDEVTMFKVYKACAQDRCVDGLWCGVLSKIEGKYPVVAGTPSEIWAYRKSSEIMRRAIVEAGRPGMFFTNNAPTATATIACWDREIALRPVDIFNGTGISDLKISCDDLQRSIWAHIHYGAPMLTSNTVAIGGFSGSLEGNAVAATATAFQGALVNRGNIIHADGNPMIAKSRCTRETIWIASMALQALTRNSNLILEGNCGDHPAAGPGTKQYFYETTAGSIAAVVSGGHVMGGTRKYSVGNIPNYGSPLESRWLGEVCKAAVGLDREKCNDIVLTLLAKYEDRINDAPEGYTLERLYNIGSMTPNSDYVRLYNEVKEETAKLTLSLK